MKSTPTHATTAGTCPNALPEKKALKAAKKKQLTDQEKKSLIDCETVIQEGKETSLKVAEALIQINKRKLYRADYKNFNQYCLEKWKFTKQHAHRLMDFATVVKEMEPIGDSLVPTNEAQARELIKVEPDQREAVMQAAVESAGDKPVTAKVIKQATKKIVGGEDKIKADKASKIIEMPEPEMEIVPLKEVVGWLEEVQENVEAARDVEDSLKLLEDAIYELENRIKWDRIKAA
jgi:hypothetical protein